jgi:hypothetical protein
MRVSFLLVVRRPESSLVTWAIVELRQTADSSMAAILGRVAASTGQKVSWEFLTKESPLDLLPKNIALDASLPTPQHAVPGRTKLVEPAVSGRSITSRSCPAESTSCR